MLSLPAGQQLPTSRCQFSRQSVPRSYYFLFYIKRPIVCYTSPTHSHRIFCNIRWKPYQIMLQRLFKRDSRNVEEKNVEHILQWKQDIWPRINFFILTKIIYETIKKLKKWLSKSIFSFLDKYQKEKLNFR